MRRLEFSLITDNRFSDEDIKKEVEKESVCLLKVLNGLVDTKQIELEYSNPYHLSFTDKGKTTYQWRINFYIYKRTRKITWDNLCGIINDVVPAPSYKLN